VQVPQLEPVLEGLGLRRTRNLTLR
jgi:hypothetical protein